MSKKSGHLNVVEGKEQNRGPMPIYLQIYDQLKEAILRGELRVGERLPSERNAQQVFHVSRMTVQAAYRKLEEMGYVLRHETRGTFVAASPQWPSAVRKEAAFRPSRTWHQLGSHFLEDLMESSLHAYRFDFEVGRPDLDIFPSATMQMLLEDLFTRKPSETLMYSPTAGLPSFRDAILRRMLPLRGMDARGIDQLLVTTGAMQAIDLIAKLFIEPDDVVIIEKPTFPGALERFRAQGARLVTVPVDRDGIDVEQLGEILKKEKTRLIYVQPSAQNPTGVNLSIARRTQLLSLAHQYKIPIVEDDATGFFAGDADALRSECDDIVLHIGTFSKIVAPGLRVGYVVGPADVIRRLTSVKQLVDLHTSPIPQLLLEGWLLSSDIPHHVASARQLYAERLAAALDELSAGPIRPVLTPKGGLYVFCRLPDGLSANLIQQQSADYGVIFAPGDGFSPDGDLTDHLRLCVSGLAIPSIHAGLRRLTRLLEELQPPS